VPAICSIAGRNFSSRRHPASVGETLRVVRFSRRTPTLSAVAGPEGGGRNAETRGSRSEAEILGAAMKAVRSASSPRRIAGLSSIPAMKHPGLFVDGVQGSLQAIEAVAELVNCFHDRMEIGRTPLAPVVQFSSLRRRTFKHSINHPETTL
jgi:hypothetical protein